jgi:hypothetical protein
MLWPAGGESLPHLLHDWAHPEGYPDLPAAYPRGQFGSGSRHQVNKECFGHIPIQLTHASGETIGGDGLTR